MGRSRLNPLTKLALAILAAAASFAVNPWFIPPGLALLLGISHAFVPGGGRRLAAAAPPLAACAAIIVAAQVLLAGHGDPWPVAGARGLVHAFRVTAMVLSASLFLATTDAVDLADAVSHALRPFGRWGARPGEIALGVMIVASFIPLMGDEVRRLQTAHLVRCGRSLRGPGGVWNVAPLVAPLVVGVMRRADEMELALRARAYRLGADRTPFAPPGIGWIDAIVLVTGIALFAAGIHANV